MALMGKSRLDSDLADWQRALAQQQRRPVNPAPNDVLMDWKSRRSAEQHF
jgi:hypothetical protein